MIMNTNLSEEDILRKGILNVNLTKFESTADIDEFCQQRPPSHNQDHVEQQETNHRDCGKLNGNHDRIKICFVSSLLFGKKSSLFQLPTFLSFRRS